MENSLISLFVSKDELAIQKGVILVILSFSMQMYSCMCAGNAFFLIVKQRINWFFNDSCNYIG